MGHNYGNIQWPDWMFSAGVPALGDMPGGGIEGACPPSLPLSRVETSKVLEMTQHKSLSSWVGPSKEMGF